MQAGELLSQKLSSYQKNPSVVVVGLARGGVVVARAIARAMDVPLDVVVVKKISSPYEPELALGAVAPDGVTHVDWRMAHRMGADEEYINQAVSRQQSAISEKTRIYRKGRKPLNLKDKTVILVDDGAATGATMEVAIKWVRAKAAKKIVVALPVVPPDTLANLKPEVSEVIVLDTPENLGSVGQFYTQFEQVSDEEVIKLLQ